MQLVDYGLLSDEETVENSVTINFEPGSLYLLAEKIFNQSTGAHRGMALSLIRTPEEQQFETAACAASSIASDGTLSRTRTFNADSTMTLSQSSATYGIRYALYKLL